MKFHDIDIVEKAREARSKGLSIKDLARKFKISSSTISKWVRDIPSKQRLYLKSKRLQEKNKNKFEASVDKTRLDKSNSRILASLLYWCEGSKYPSSNVVSFSNSDYKLVKTFLELIRLGFKLDESKFRVQLQLHTTHDEIAMIKFWSELLNIPKDKFYKSTITKPTGRMKRTDYKGTCAVRYNDVRILFQLTGIFEKFAQKMERYPRG